MGRAMLIACVPWLGWLVVSFFAIFLLLRASRARLELGRLRRLHADQHGSTQSLSFVLTLPLFIMIILFIVQVSQLMIGQIVVEYAAFAAARAAAVWIPADLSLMDPMEGPNCIGDGHGPVAGGTSFFITSNNAQDLKYNKITFAAVMACMSISPSRDMGVSLSGQGPAVVADSITRAYAALASSSEASAAAISKRIENNRPRP